MDLESHSTLRAFPLPLVAVVSGWLALPSLMKIIRLQPALLFQEASTPQDSKSKTAWIFALPALLGFWGLWLYSRVPRTWPISSFFACLVVFSFFATGSLGLSVLSRVSQNPPQSAPAHPFTDPQQTKHHNRFSRFGNRRTSAQSNPPVSVQPRTGTGIRCQ